MTSKKSNSKIFFVLIPIFMLAIAVVFDTIMNFAMQRYFTTITQNVMKDALTYNPANPYQNIKEYYEKKNMETDLLEVTAEDNYIIVYNTHAYNSFFGKVIGISKYRVTVYLKAHIENGKTVFEELNQENLQS